MQYSLPSEIFNCQQTSNCIPQTLPRKDNYTMMHFILPIEAIICPLICLSPPRASPSVGRYLRRRVVRELKKPFGRLPTFSSGKAVAEWLLSVRRLPPLAQLDECRSTRFRAYCVETMQSWAHHVSSQICTSPRDCQRSIYLGQKAVRASLHALQ